jgi:hypothetical protein
MVSRVVLVQDSSWYFSFPCHSFIAPVAPQSSPSVIQGWYNRPIKMAAVIVDFFHSSPIDRYINTILLLNIFHCQYTEIKCIHTKCQAQFSVPLRSCVRQCREYTLHTNTTISLYELREVYLGQNHVCRYDIICCILHQ